ncbi:hypothetical protein AMATHDRAFT_183471 [Amanita thiersii Skay4041]|uniref:Reverse transcriptase domain-containing protein n=1 Tax=Amanita thiersii Skay4041 TaxID=703135 RepID=A0A2A9NFD1_9AGAR|nr:hypothetical protein AMATHDRAFT_183471 [Amanita thiersii Skay4041]
MYAMPIRAVPKSNGNFRLVADQSLGQYSLNSMVEPHEEAFPLDNMTQLGEAILKAREKQGSRTALTLFKCDVAEAYRILPMHPCWQIKQIYTIDGERYVDRNNSFGGTRSGDLFISFMSLVVWIARTLKGVDNLLAYCDDTFGVAAAADKLYYDKYKKKFPRPQTLLLQLWDELGIPHKLEKQQFGNPLTIIGIAVECGKKKDTMSLPKDVRQGLLDELQRFIDSKADNQFTLREFRNMAGWLSWALNIFPLLRPALNNVYPEMAGRTNKNKTMPVSEAVRSDLRWAAGHLKESSGVRVMNCQGDENGAESVTAEWTPTDPNHIVYCDSTTNNIAFWIPKRSTGFVAPIPDGYSSKIIFFWEILCVTLAMDHILKKASKKRLLVYCDNKDIVLILNTLKCRPEYNGLLRQISDRLMAGDHDLRVVLSKPEENSKKIADALAKGDLTSTLRLQSNITITSFQIPKELLGAAAGLSMSTFKGLWENLRAYIPSLS